MKVRHLVLAFATLSSAYLSWSVLGRTTAPVDGGELAPTPLRIVEVDGPLDGASDLVAVQPHLVVRDYASAAALEQKLRQTFDVAATSGLFGERTLVVLPAFIGTPLLFVGEKREALEIGTFQGALDLVLESNVPLWLASYATTRAPDRARAATFAMKGPQMAAAYHGIMSRLAADYRVVLVAGSILLPAPRLEGGRLVTGSGALAEVSCVYDASGGLLGLSTAVGRSALTKDLFDEPAIEGARVIDTPVGKLGVLIGEDALRFDVADSLRRGGAQLLAVPAFLRPDDVLRLPFAPDNERAWDLHGADLTLGEVWQRYGPNQRAREMGARAVVTAVLRGELWDLGDDGQSAVFVDGQDYRGPDVKAGALVGARFAVAVTPALDAAPEGKGAGKGPGTFAP